jgi:hypothetical protein
MTDSIYADVEAEARAHWLTERPDGERPGDQEPNEILARAEAEWAVRRAELNDDRNREWWSE